MLSMSIQQFGSIAIEICSWVKEDEVLGEDVFLLVRAAYEMPKIKKLQEERNAQKITLLLLVDVSVSNESSCTREECLPNGSNME